MSRAKNILALVAISGAVLVSLCLPSIGLLQGRAHAQNSNVQANSNSNTKVHAKRKLTKQNRTYAGIKRADLRIAEVEALDEHTLRVRVANGGQVISNGCEMVMFYHRGGQVVERGVNVTAIAVGGSLWFNIDAFGSLLENASKITLLVDYHDTVRESNETNNEFVFKE